jgi:hypothetical protein
LGARDLDLLALGAKQLRHRCLAMTDWADELSEDYHAAAVRLATLTEGGIQHLLFASVEMYPHEIPAPPQRIERQRKNFGDATLSVGIVVMPIADVQTWYENALAGDMRVPGLTHDVAVTTAPFSPEPIWGRLLISNDLPFALPWHGGLRIHRLVPTADLADPVAGLSAAQESERQTNIRGWLGERLGFDLLAYDDFLGGVVLLAPNPVARGVGTYIKETLADGSERLGVKAALRQGVDATTLAVRLREERPGGVSILESRLDPFAMAELIVPEQTHRLGLELVCDKRGVLSIETPAYFFRSFHLTSQSTVHQGEVKVPARRRGTPARSNLLMTVRPDPYRPTSPQPPAGPSARSGALRLNILQTRREARTGYRRADGYFQSADHGERVFFNNRLDSALFVQGLIRRAHERVILVDPYFDEIDVREFAIVTMYDGVTVSVLTGRRDHLWWKKINESNESVFAGDVFAADLEQLNAELQVAGRAPPAIVLMGEASRVYHDRFLVVDDVVWHFGHSFNQIGDASVSMATRLSHPDEIRTMICEDVGNAALFDGGKEGALGESRRGRRHETRASAEGGMLGKRGSFRRMTRTAWMKES